MSWWRRKQEVEPRQLPARIAIVPHEIGGMPMMKNPFQGFGEHVESFVLGAFSTGPAAKLNKFATSLSAYSTFHVERDCPSRALSASVECMIWLTI